MLGVRKRGRTMGRLASAPRRRAHSSRCWQSPWSPWSSVAADADLTVAALVYIVVVVLTALLGYWAGAVGAVLSYLA